MHIKVKRVGKEPTTDPEKYKGWTTKTPGEKIRDWGSVQLSSSYKGRPMSGEEYFPRSFRKLF
jgi:hypothetical protein